MDCISSKIKMMGVELLGLEAGGGDRYVQQPEGLRALLVGLSGSHKSESGSTAGVMYDYINASMIIDV